MRDRSKVPPSCASARNGRGRNFGTFTERSKRALATRHREEVMPHDEQPRQATGTGRGERL